MYGLSLKPFVNDKDINARNFDVIRGILINKKLLEKNINYHEKKRVEKCAGFIRKDLLSYAKAKVS